MPLHMLPPPLLRASCLSDRQPNECLSAMLQLDALGRVRHSRLVRSVLPPVRILSFERVDVLLSYAPIESQVNRELRELADVTRRRT
jgi:exoribonuclease R